MINRIDKDSTAEVIERANAALAQVAKDLGLTFRPSRGKYDPHLGSVVVQGEFRVQSLNGVPVEQADFNRRCALYGLKPEHYKAKLQVRAPGGLTEVEVIGFELKRSRYPIRVRVLSTGEEVLVEERALARIPGYTPSVLPTV